MSVEHVKDDSWDGDVGVEDIEWLSVEVKDVEWLSVVDEK